MLRSGSVSVFVFAIAATVSGQQPDWLIAPQSFVARAETERDGSAITLDNGALRLGFRLQPDAALVDWTTGPESTQRLRAVSPLCRLWFDGVEFAVGGLRGQQNRAFLAAETIPKLTANAEAFHCAAVTTTPIAERLQWGRVRPCAPDAVWPPRGVAVHLRCEAPPALAASKLEVTVHVELYDGLPLWAQWFTVHNGGDRAVELDRFVLAELAMVEAESRVEPERLGVALPDVHVETDFAFHAMTAADGSSHCVRWLDDPAYTTQVNYQCRTRCLLQVGPDLGPAQTIAPGATFESCRAWFLSHDGDRDRRDRAMRRMYRTLAPWCTENPLLMHLVDSRDEAVRAAVDQCVAAGFEMVVLSFGSGFDMEDDSEANLRRWRGHAEYAHARGVQIGGYSLLSSRRIEPDGDNCIDRATGKPGGQIFGYAPALASEWGRRYFAKLRRFLTETGFDLLEHDGSYPGDADAAARSPLQKGWADSQWAQHAIIADFYRWCRARGVYLNVPDWYFLQGSSKTGMGYRETNWSLPRAEQVLHARQNLFDGTRQKTPSMGWMFAPLTEYHGGGAAATIEPLAEHRDHYELLLASNLGYGAQACWRGTRLYDGEETLALLRRWVDWYKSHRTILESDVVHTGSRRADGRDLDWVLHESHGSTESAERAMLVVFNPTGVERRRALAIDLAMVSAAERLEARFDDGSSAGTVAPDGHMTLDLRVPAAGVRWICFERAR